MISPDQLNFSRPDSLADVYEHMYPGQQWGDLKMLNAGNLLEFIDTCVSPFSRDADLRRRISRSHKARTGLLEKIEFKPDKLTFRKHGVRSFNSNKSLDTKISDEILTVDERTGNSVTSSALTDLEFVNVAFELLVNPNIDILESFNLLYRDRITVVGLLRNNEPNGVIYYLPGPRGILRKVNNLVPKLNM